MKNSLLTLMFIWLAWAVIIVTYQEYVPGRFTLNPPDNALSWTHSETLPGSQKDKIFLMEPFLNTHVAWDSEYYLAIAKDGYNSAGVATIDTPTGKLSLNYAFFPLYAWATRLVAFPFNWAGMKPIAADVMGGLLVSLLGTLAAMWGLYDLSREKLGEKGGIRAAFYLIIFPTGFFLAQIYTEGLFCGLAFCALALIRRKQFLLAGLLSALAVWTRAVGVLLLIPLGWAALQELHKQGFAGIFKQHGWIAWLAALLPVASYSGWALSPLATNFHIVEQNFFGRGFLRIGDSFFAWAYAFDRMLGGNPQATTHYLMEITLLMLALVTSLAMLKKYPGLALFSLAVWMVSIFSGSPQSTNRYVLACPAMFLFLAEHGENEAFDRGWTLFSILWMGLLTILFTFNFWVA